MDFAKFLCHDAKSAILDSYFLVILSSRAAIDLKIDTWKLFNMRNPKMTLKTPGNVPILSYR